MKPSYRIRRARASDSSAANFGDSGIRIWALLSARCAACCDRDVRRRVGRGSIASPLSTLRISRVAHTQPAQPFGADTAMPHSKALSGRAARSSLRAPFGAPARGIVGNAHPRCRLAASHCACSSRCGLQRPPQADCEGNEDVCRPGASPQLSTALGLGGCAATHRAIAASGHAAPRKQESDLAQRATRQSGIATRGAARGLTRARVSDRRRRLTQALEHMATAQPTCSLCVTARACVPSPLGSPSTAAPAAAFSLSLWRRIASPYRGHAGLFGPILDSK